MVKTGKILIVDDDVNYHRVISEILGNQYQLTSVMGGREALSLLQEQSFDLVLLDVTMSGLSGIETLERIMGRWPATVVIMNSVIADSETIKKAMKLGARDYLFKYEDTEITINQIGNVFEKTTRVEG